jgi:hypothetical protein
LESAKPDLPSRLDKPGGDFGPFLDNGSESRLPWKQKVSETSWPHGSGAQEINRISSRLMSTVFASIVSRSGIDVTVALERNETRRTRGLPRLDPVARSSGLVG